MQQALFALRLSDLFAREYYLLNVQVEHEGLALLAAQLTSDPPLPWQKLPDDTAAIVNSIIDECDGEMSALAESDVTRFRWLLNRAVINVFRHDIDAARADVDAVLAVDEWHPRALLLQTRLLFYSGELQMALKTAKRISGKESHQAVYLLAETLIAAGDLDKSAQLYIQLNQSSNADLRTLERARLLRTHSGKRDAAAFSTLVSLLLPGERATTLMALTRAEHELLFGTANVAEAIINEQYEMARGNSRRWLAWQAGRVFAMTGNALRATDWYSEAISDEEESDTLLHREYVHVLFKADLLTAAYERARAIRAAHEGRPVVGITEIEADCLLKGGEASAARDLIDALSEESPYYDRQNPPQ